MGKSAAVGNLDTVSEYTHGGEPSHSLSLSIMSNTSISSYSWSLSCSASESVSRSAVGLTEITCTVAWIVLSLFVVCFPMGFFPFAVSFVPVSLVMPSIVNWLLQLVLDFAELPSYMPFPVVCCLDLSPIVL